MKFAIALILVVGSISTVCFAAEGRRRPSDTDVRDLFAACLATRQAEASSFFLAHSDMGSLDVDAYGGPNVELGRKLGIEQCLTWVGDKTGTQVSIKTGRSALRAIAIEGTYRLRFPQSPIWLEDPAPSKPRTFVSTGEKLTIAQANGIIADCLFAADPKGIDALIRLSSESVEEQALVSTLLPKLEKCKSEHAVPAGKEMSLREFAAEGLWQAAISTAASAEATATNGSH